SSSRGDPKGITRGRASRWAGGDKQGWLQELPAGRRVLDKRGSHRRKEKSTDKGG
ncbi:hypothetical protein U1Q18_038195, partial [Sarracenia purpurea var. burkii]